MPIVRVEMLQGRSQEVKQGIARQMTDVLVRELGVDAHHVYVMFNEVAHPDWAVGGVFFNAPAAPAKDGG